MFQHFINEFCAFNVLSFTVCSIRKLLNNQQDLNSDGEDEDEFVPSKKELQSSSEDDDGKDEAGLDSDEEVMFKKGRHAAAGSRTPRSKQKTRSSARTPRKTPNKKVKVKQLETSKSEGVCFSHLVSFDCFLFRQITPGTPRTPRGATPSIPSRSLPARQPANVLEEARMR